MGLRVLFLVRSPRFFRRLSPSGFKSEEAAKSATMHGLILMALRKVEKLCLKMFPTDLKQTDVFLPGCFGPLPPESVSSVRKS